MGSRRKNRKPGLVALLAAMGGPFLSGIAVRSREPQRETGEDPIGANPWRVYLVRCSDGSLYCGITVNFDKRFENHNNGKASKYTRSRLPVELSLISHEMSESSARRLEAKIKKLPADRKQHELLYYVDVDFDYAKYRREGSTEPTPERCEA